MLPSGDAALVGMAAMAVAVIGAPLTMAMLVFEATKSFLLTGAVMAASLIASTIVRETFGYSFSTWRLHLRGETIKSARDVGWVRLLTAGRMMRHEVQEIPADGDRRRIPPPLSARRGQPGRADRPERRLCRDHPARDRLCRGRDAGDRDRHAGAHAAAAARTRRTISSRSWASSTWCRPTSSRWSAMTASCSARLSEKFVRKRYAEELEKAQRDLFGE